MARDRYVRIMITDEDKAASRGFLIREAVKASLEHDLPGILASDSQISVGLFKEDNTMIGVLYLQLSER